MTLRIFLYQIADEYTNFNWLNGTRCGFVDEGNNVGAERAEQDQTVSVSRHWTSISAKNNKSRKKKSIVANGKSYVRTKSVTKNKYLMEIQGPGGIRTWNARTKG